MEQSQVPSGTALSTINLMISSADNLTEEEVKLDMRKWEEGVLLEPEVIEFLSLYFNPQHLKRIIQVLGEKEVTFLTSNSLS
jgi:hypothetical protein